MRAARRPAQIPARGRRSCGRRGLSTGPRPRPGRRAEYLAMPIATLRQEPPRDRGVRASRPSAALTGRKSISASPQLISKALTSDYGLAAGVERLHRHPCSPDPAAASGVDLPFGGMEAGHGRRHRLRRRPNLDIAVIAARREGETFPATAPSMAAPSRTGSAVLGRATVRPVVSAMICRTRGLRLAPPLITIMRQEIPCARITSTTSASP